MQHIQRTTGIDKVVILENAKFSVQAEHYLSESLNLPSIIAGTCFMGLISEHEVQENF